ncbi:MAG TPA: hypothetical protein VMH35_11265 [Streptosporangiaceae bacterium]|nr:hypothetical protein [Streptosporangiaceae bacterium]
MTEGSRDPDYPPRDNVTSSGLHITGGSFSGNIAMSNNGPVTQYSHDGKAAESLAEIGELLRQLEAGLRDMDGTAAEGAIDDIDVIRGEMSVPQPAWARIGRLLSRVGAAAAPVSSLVELADRARDLIMTIAH